VLVGKSPGLVHKISLAGKIKPITHYFWEDAMLTFIFGKKEEKSEASREIGQRVGIGYDPHLINRLKDDHQELVEIFTEIMAAASVGHFRRISSKLSEFKLALQTHIAVENVRLYVYIQQRYAQDVDTSDFVTGLRSEMNGIARAVVKFAEKYTETPPVASTSADFVSGLEEIGAVLVKRVQLEESRLYSLYLR
jgi:iron-sulfur cluster repair protein YtfE (RIC family)